ncbi:hypothetical protein [Bacillus cereus]|uniref:hypothetical protein n=1 Tax=Bacillus cereus TaxID=1396 RepID=UPI00301310DD
MNTIEQKEYGIALDAVREKITIPKGYELKKVKSVKQNKEEVFVFRFEKITGNNNGLGGEHYSFTVSRKNHKLLGVTWMDQIFSIKGELPTQKRTEEIAHLFLEKVEPGLFHCLENLWIRPHDESVITNGKQAIVTGMKYKCYLPDKDSYAWVIVGSNDQVITFEQGIKWENGRLTEKWLHDSWF